MLAVTKVRSHRRPGVPTPETVQEEERPRLAMFVLQQYSLVVADDFGVIGPVGLDERVDVGPCRRARSDFI
jgi:hypothetical protein